MRTVAYKTVRDNANALYGAGGSTSTGNAANLNVVINTRAREFWEMFFWPEWTVVEPRTFRVQYASATTYVAGNEVYYPATKAYYHAIRSVPISTPPATGGGGSYATNKAYWAESLGEYSGDDWSSTRAYIVGDQVYQPADGNFYQCHTTHTNQPPPNDTYWGALVPFYRSIDYSGGNQGAGATPIGEVKTVWDRDPYAVEDARPISFWTTTSNVLVRGTENKIWLEFRLRPPSWTGNTWAATTTYAVGEQVFYGTDFYVAIQSGSNQNPATQTPYWTKLEFPYVLANAVQQAACADLLRLNGKHNKAGVELAEAMRFLHREFDKIERQQGQTTPLNVLTR